jgi:DNA helicase-2/ATP-dependent DNA helicase PcrA
MTVHMAKGLEFAVVFLVGLEDGIFPHSRSIDDPKELEEERRLAYVAITRAEKILYVMHAMRRRTYGEEFASEPSQFLNELPLELVEDLSHGASWLSYARSSTTIAAKAMPSSSRGETVPQKPKAVYTGKTYNNADAVAEFFKKKGVEGSLEPPPPATTRAKPFSAPSVSSTGVVPGSHVTHERYGKGLVLRREGSGDNVKLTISFPGFGQKKLIEKYANLRRD